MTLQGHLRSQLAPLLAAPEPEAEAPEVVAGLGAVPAPQHTGSTVGSQTVSALTAPLVDSTLASRLRPGSRA